MNARLAHRRADVAHAKSLSRSVYLGTTLAGHVHPVDDGWLAVDADDEPLGRFKSAPLAAHKVAIEAMARRP